MKFAIFAVAAALFIGAWIVPAQQNHSLAYIKQIDDHSHLITIDGIQFLAIDIDRVKENQANKVKLAEAKTEITKLNDSLARAEHDLDLSKQNTQDERLRNQKLQQMYDGQVDLSKQCFSLLKKGGGKLSWLSNPLFQIGKDVALTAAQMAKCK